ncbi:selenium metabolism protein YedF [Orenia metallireducens]|jgi:selenium metabolism protein YedF|uniref:Selenium metabolism protein YedF n=1 Tax=Orenia metallireducens TaxID=1413210 RepID=A0A285GJF9_9FIRM|nr:sulfurtransferase-like selenium metabolism protein YedF [Orenia metallireducens]PRX30428.1 selenium metabolism protein YedF [Orenia metallireducens]SNY22481.1 selenium metabolism protein YedF [Orenia metallireducens]
MKELDVRGMICPKPVIETKKALEKSDKLLVLLDDQVAKDNVMKLAKKLNCQVTLLEDGNEYQLTIKKTDMVVEKQDESGGKVYFISTDTLGKGEEELGYALMKGFVSTLLEINPLPAKIIFINSGVKIPTLNQQAQEHLQQLVEQGVEVVSCGACLNYYGLTEKLEVGSITNMYEIVESLNTGEVVSL